MADGAIRRPWGRSSLAAGVACLVAAGTAVAVAALVNLPWVDAEDVDGVGAGVVVLLLSAVAMQRAVGAFDLKRLTIPAVWYFLYAGLIVVPAFGVFAGQSGPYRRTYLFSVVSSLVTVPIGIAAVSSFLRFRRTEIDAWYRSPIERRSDGVTPKLTYLAALTLLLGLTGAWAIEQVTPIPLLYLFAHPGEAGALADLRDYSFKLLDSPIRYLYHLARDFGFPVLIIMSIGYYRKTRDLVWLAFLLVTAGVGIVFAGANVARSPVMSIFFLVFLFLYLYEGGRIPRRALLFGLPAALAFPVMVGIVSQGGTVAEGVQKMYERIFVAPSLILYYFFEVVPQHVGFLGGRGMGSILKLIGVEPVDLGHFVGEYVLGPGGSGYTSATGAFVAGLYTDFGLVGVLTGGLLVGAVMQWVQISLLRDQKTVFSIGVYCFACYAFATLTYLQVAGALLLSGLPILWVLLRLRRVSVRPQSS